MEFIISNESILSEKYKADQEALIKVKEICDDPKNIEAFNLYQEKHKNKYSLISQNDNGPYVVDIADMLIRRYGGYTLKK